MGKTVYESRGGDRYRSRSRSINRQKSMSPDNREYVERTERRQLMLKKEKEEIFFKRQIEQGVNLMCRIYIGCISFEVTEEQIRAAFRSFGPIKAISMAIDHAKGHHRGFCFLDYHTPEAAMLAQEKMAGTLFFGRNLKVGRPSNLPLAQEVIKQIMADALQYHRIYVSPVKIGISVADLIALFEAFGPVMGIELKYQEVGENGYAYIEYDNALSMRYAIEKMNGFLLADLSLWITRAITPPEKAKTETSDPKNELLPPEKAGPAVSAAAAAAAAARAVSEQIAKMEAEAALMQQLAQEPTGAFMKQAFEELYEQQARDTNNHPGSSYHSVVASNNDRSERYHSENHSDARQTSVRSHQSRSGRYSDNDDRDIGDRDRLGLKSDRSRMYEEKSDDFYGAVMPVWPADPEALELKSERKESRKESRRGDRSRSRERSTRRDRRRSRSRDRRHRTGRRSKSPSRSRDQERRSHRSRSNNRYQTTHSERNDEKRSYKYRSNDPHDSQSSIRDYQSQLSPGGRSEFLNEDSVMVIGMDSNGEELLKSYRDPFNRARESILRARGGDQELPYRL